MASIVQYAWAISAAGLLIDFFGFVILMTELAASQRTEFRTYHHDLVIGIDELRLDLKRWLDDLHARLQKLIPERGNPYHALRELLDVYFSDEFSRTAYDKFVAKYDLHLNDEDEIGLLEHVNFALAVKAAHQALDTLDRDRVIEGLSEIERKWFSDWYPLPKLTKGGVLQWYQAEMWGTKKPRWLSDNNVFFRAVEYRKQALLKRRSRFYVGAVLVLLGFAFQLFGGIAQPISVLFSKITHEVHWTQHVT